VRALTHAQFTAFSLDSRISASNNAPCAVSGASATAEVCIPIPRQSSRLHKPGATTSDGECPRICRRGTDRCATAAARTRPPGDSSGVASIEKQQPRSGMLLLAMS